MRPLSRDQASRPHSRDNISRPLSRDDTTADTPPASIVGRSESPTLFSQTTAAAAISEARSQLQPLHEHIENQEDQDDGTHITETNSLNEEPPTLLSKHAQHSSRSHDVKPRLVVPKNVLSKIIMSGPILHYSPDDPGKENPNYDYYTRHALIDYTKGYLKVFMRPPRSPSGSDMNPRKNKLADDFADRPRLVAYLHSAKVTETGRRDIHGQQAFTFSVRSISKPPSGGNGPEFREDKFGVVARAECREWVKAIGKTVVSVASLPEVEGRIRKASRHRLAVSTTARRLHVRHKRKKKYLRRPSGEDFAEKDEDGDEVKVEPIATDSVSLHPTDRKWILSKNNFAKAPARPRTQTAAETIPDSIIQAIYKNDLDAVIVYLGTHRAFDHMHTRSGDKLLHTACSTGNFNLALFFLDKGAKPNLQDGYGETPLYCAVKNRSVKVAGLLLERGAKVNEGASDGVTPLSLACANGDLEMVVFLLDSGGNPMTADIRGITPFFTACAQGHFKVVKVLLEMNRDIPGIVDIHKTTNNDITPFYASCQRGCLEVVQLLVALGADHDKPNLQRITPFHAAVERGEIAVCKYLLDELGSDPMTTNASDMTCVHTAAKFGRTETLEWLVKDIGLDVNCTDQYGATPLDVARTYSKPECIVLVSELGGIPGNDFLRDPKSRAKSEYMKIMLHRGDLNDSLTGAAIGAGGHDFYRLGEKAGLKGAIGIIEDNEVF